MAGNIIRSDGPEGGPARVEVVRFQFVPMECDVSAKMRDKKCVAQPPVITFTLLVFIKIVMNSS